MRLHPPTDHSWAAIHIVDVKSITRIFFLLGASRRGCIGLRARDERFFCERPEVVVGRFEEVFDNLAEEDDDAAVAELAPLDAKCEDSVADILADFFFNDFNFLH